MKKCFLQRTWLICWGLCFLLVASRVVAQELPAELERQANNFFSVTMSPFCPGRTLSDCPSASASELKDHIKKELAAGKNLGDIEEQLYAKYGEALRSTPPTKGFGIVAWLAVPVFLVIGLLLIISFAGTKRKTVGSNEAVELSSDMQKRIAERLRN